MREVECKYIFKEKQGRKTFNCYKWLCSLFDFLRIMEAVKLIHDFENIFKEAITVLLWCVGISNMLEIILCNHLNIQWKC